MFLHLTTKELYSNLIPLKQRIDQTITELPAASEASADGTQHSEQHREHGVTDGGHRIGCYVCLHKGTLVKYNRKFACYLRYT